MASLAASLWERVDALRHVAQAGPPASPAGAALTLDDWVRACSPGDAPALSRRLAWDGLDSVTATAALAGPVETAADLPGWLDWIEAILAEADILSREYRGTALPDCDPWLAATEPPFVELAVAVCRTARHRLQDDARPVAADLCADVSRAIEQQLMAEIGSCWSAALYEAFDASRQPGENPRREGNYRRFIESMLGGELKCLFLAYPVLARQVTAVADAWVSSVREFTERLHRDRALIEQAIGGGAPIGRLARIWPALSDPHDGRRRVMALEFEHGQRLIYKPRPVGLEKAFFDFLQWALSNGLEPAQRVMQVIDCERYGWMEFARHDRFENCEQVARYYRIGGGLLCLAHLLGGADLHMENIVATRDGPVLVDTEMLLQPSRRPMGRAADDAVASWREAASSSCLATGLLSLIESGPGGSAFDIGGLRGSGASVPAVGQHVYRHLRSDLLRVAEEPSFRARTANAVVLDGEPQRPEWYGGALLDGFRDTYSFLLSKRDELLASSGPLARFRGHPTRLLVRPSNQYATLAQVIERPRYQQDGARQSLAIETLARPFARSVAKPWMWPVVAAERRALEQLDIPRFTVPADGTVITAGTGPPIEHGVAASGLQSVEARLRDLSDTELQDQAWRVRMALVETVDSHFAAPFSPPSVWAPDRAAGVADMLVSAAEWIADELLSRRDGGLNWPHLVAPARRSESRAHHLYDGTLGAALFLAALGRVTGVARWTRVARDTALRIRHAVSAAAGDPGAADGLGICSGTGSIAYGLSLLGRLHDDASCTELARDYALRIAPDAIAADRALDVVRGSAGAILALLAVHRSAADSRLVDLAVRCGDRLLACETQTADTGYWDTRSGSLVGMAHGAAGIGLALLRLADLTGRDDFRQSGARAVRMVMGQEDLAGGRWPIAYRAPGSDDAAPGMIAWCHGSPGIALALGEALDLLGDHAILPPVIAALDATARAGPHVTEHLCCGTLGRCDALLTVGRRLDLPVFIDAAIELGTGVVSRAAARRHVRLSSAGAEYAVFDPGFFRGLSGVGYQLLRLAEPATLPSILAFE